MGQTWTDEDLRRLGRWVALRRIDLGYTSQDAFAGAEPKIGTSTIQHLELGRVLPARKDTRTRYERKLRVEPGTLVRMLDDPEHVPVTVKATGVELRSGEITYPAVVAATEELTDREREKLLAVLLDAVHNSRRARSA